MISFVSRDTFSSHTRIQWGLFGQYCNMEINWNGSQKSREQIRDKAPNDHPRGWSRNPIAQFWSSYTVKFTCWDYAQKKTNSLPFFPSPNRQVVDERWRTSVQFASPRCCSSFCWTDSTVCQWIPVSGWNLVYLSWKQVEFLWPFLYLAFCTVASSDLEQHIKDDFVISIRHIR